MAEKGQKHESKTKTSILSGIRRLLSGENSSSETHEKENLKQSKANKTNIPLQEKDSAMRKKVKRYTIEYPDYTPIERSTPYLSYPCNDSRFYMEEEGRYAATKPRDEDSAVLFFTGDIMCRGGQQNAAMDRYGEYRFNDSFSEVKKVFDDSDLVAGNLETTLCASSPYMSEVTPINGRPHDNAPATFLAAIRHAGFDLIAMANNHNCDAGVYGILDTLKNVEDYGFMHTGTFSGTEQQRYLIVDVNGIKIAFLSYATYYNRKDEFITEKGRRILLNKYGKKRVENAVQEARSKGAEFVVAYIHWGTEHKHAVNKKQMERAQGIADAGVDYIIGSHPHVLQKYDSVTAKDGRQVPVYYSLGNFLSNMSKTESNKYTAIARLELTRREDGKVVIADESFIPCYIFDEWQDADFVTVPLTSEPANIEQGAFFREARQKIKEVMGEKIQEHGNLVQIEKSKDEMQKEQHMLKREYGIPEEDYYACEFDTMPFYKMIHLAEKMRLTRYRTERIAEETGLDEVEIEQALSEAAKKGISEKDYYEGKFYLYPNMEAHAKELEKERKRAGVKTKMLRQIMEETGWSEGQTRIAIKNAEDNFGITPRVYFRNRYYQKSETVMARLNTARLTKKKRLDGMFNAIERETGKTKETVRREIRELNEKHEGLELKLFGYYIYELQNADEEKTEKTISAILRKKEIEEIFDGRDHSLIEEYKKILKEILSKRGKRYLFEIISNALPELKMGDKNTEDLLIDMQMTQELMGFSTSEYISYKMWDKTIEERQNYISNEFKATMLKKVNTLAGRSVADNKYEMYQLLKPYYGRDAMLIDNIDGYAAFKAFCDKHTEFVKKSNFDSLGVGLKKISHNKEDLVLRDVYDDLTAKGKKILLEELIEPHPAVAFLNPDSVNTIRVATFVDYKGEVSIQDCSMRVGHSGSFVDNAGTGGILIHVDKNTGIFDTDGVDKTGKRYETHPEHGYVFKGYQLPAWDDFRSTMTELANKVEGLRYIGWDMTCTKDGKWIIVECNAIMQFFGQQATVEQGKKQVLMNTLSPTINYLEGNEEQDS